MAVLFSPFGNSQFVTSAGDPAVGWKLYTYAAGSSTPLATYTDITGLTAQSNPIILNSLGFPTNGQVWLTSGLSYKIVLTDASDVVQKTEDNITGVTGAASVSQWIASGLTPTFISATQFTLAGDQTSAFHVGRRLQSTNTSGTIYSTITVSAFAALTTITVVNDSGVLDSGLSAVNYGILTAVDPSVPSTYAKSGANSDITSLTALTSINGVPVGMPMLHVRDQKATTTASGASVAGDQTRVLNTVVTNTIANASLSASQITLPVGIYRVSAATPAYNVNNHRAYIRNITDGVDEILGGAEFAGAGTIGSTSRITGAQLVVSGSAKVYELRQNTSLATATNGLGVAANDGRAEVYAELIVYKVA